MRLTDLFESRDFLPTPYYHGSNNKFDGPVRISTSGLYGPGFYMSNRRSYAAGHGSIVTEFKVHGPLATGKQFEDAVKEAALEGYIRSAKEKRASELLKARGFTGVEDYQITVVFDVKDIMLIRKSK